VDNAYRQRLAQLRELRTTYAEWHRSGMHALERGDLKALEAAVNAERDIIQRQSELLRDLIAQRAS
jgi:hypothetical protein